jgi:site-specific DNA recombinase
VVAYCRVSTLEQKKKGYGIDIQIRDATLCAERHGLLVETFYKDEAESGIKEERPELKRLLKDCRSKRIGTVILPSLDRLSREVRIAENLFHEFKKFCVKVLIADMPQYNGERKDVLIRQILEAIAEENRKDIIDRLLKGRQERVRRGLFAGGNLPYGFKRDARVVTVCDDEAEIVRTIFTLAGQCMTGQAIADELNRQRGVRRNGKLWTQRQVARILQREDLYCNGLIRYGDVKGHTARIMLNKEAAGDHSKWVAFKMRK